MTLDPAVVSSRLTELLGRLRAAVASYHRGEGDQVLHHLDAALQMFGDPPAAPAPPTSVLLPLPLPLHEALDRYIGAAVDHHDGSRQRAAAALRIGRRSVQYALQRLRARAVLLLLFLLPSRALAAGLRRFLDDYGLLVVIAVLAGGLLYALLPDPPKRQGRRPPKGPAAGALVAVALGLWGGDSPRSLAVTVTSEPWSADQAKGGRAQAACGARGLWPRSSLVQAAGPPAPELVLLRADPSVGPCHPGHGRTSFVGGCGGGPAAAEWRSHAHLPRGAIHHNPGLLVRSVIRGLFFFSHRLFYLWPPTVPWLSRGVGLEGGGFCLEAARAYCEKVTARRGISKKRAGEIVRRSLRLRAQEAQREETRR